MELVRGQVVTSRSGRDVTRAYVVLSVQGDARSGKQRAVLVNGFKWTLAQPKHKNPKHLQPTSHILADAEMQTDEKINTALAEYCKNRGAEQRGG